MRSVFVLALSAIATLAAAAENPFNIPKGGYEFAAGKTTTLNWEPTSEGTVTLKLQWGEVLTPNSGSTIISNLPNSGTYTWAVPSNIGDRPDYTIQIISDEDGETSNYLPRFSVDGAEPVTSTTTASTTTKTTETSSTATPTTMTTTTTTSTTSSTTTTSTTTTSTPTPTPSSTSSSSSTTTTASSADASASAESTPTSVPNNNAGMINRVSGGMMALVVGAVALI